MILKYIYFFVTIYINTAPPTNIKGKLKDDNVEPEVFITLFAILAYVSTTLLKSLFALVTKLFTSLCIGFVTLPAS